MSHSPLRFYQDLFKRGFDVVVAVCALLTLGWVIFVAAVIAAVETGESGFFTQVRIGRFARPFRIIKIRTMRSNASFTTVVTTAADPRITRSGRFFRRYKIDELPQLINVLRGEMSLVGPRPDVEEYANMLTGADRIILTVRPGITGPATLRFRNEEAELATQLDPERYNRDVIFPEKVRLNREYIEQYTIMNDLRYLVATITGAPWPGSHGDRSLTTTREISDLSL